MALTFDPNFSGNPQPNAPVFGYGSVGNFFKSIGNNVAGIFKVQTAQSNADQAAMNAQRAQQALTNYKVNNPVSPQAALRSNAGYSYTSPPSAQAPTQSQPPVVQGQSYVNNQNTLLSNSANTAASVYGKPTGNVTDVGNASFNPSLSNPQATSFTQVNVNPNTQATSDSFQGQPTTYNDVLKAIQKNSDNAYQMSLVKQQELADQQAVVKAYQDQQNFNLGIEGQKIGEYGIGSSLQTANALANGYDFATTGADGKPLYTQLQKIYNQNAFDAAQRQLAYEQGNRQIGATAAQNQVQNSMGMAGLLKPQEITPGSSLISPNGQIVYQGSGMTPQAYTQSVASWAQAYMSQGQDQATAITNAEATVKQLMGNGQNGATGTQTGSQTGTQNYQQPPLYSASSPNSVAGYNVSAYNGGTDPNYTQEIAQSTSSVQQSVQSFGPQGIGQFLQSQKSPLSGDMVYNAALQNGIRPDVFLGMIGHESNFGTSPVAQKNNNYGGTTFVGQANAVQGSPRPANEGGYYAKFLTPQDGLNAMAKDIARTHETNQPSQFGAAADTSGILNQVKAQFNPNLQNAVRTTATGIPYVDTGDLAGGLVSQAQTRAAQLGLKAFSSNDVKGLEALDNISMALNQMTVLSQNQLNPAGTAGIGKVGNFFKNFYGSLTGTNPQLSDFGIYKDTAVKSVTALQGGAGSGLRINMPTIEAAINNLPTAYDGREQAMEKIDKTRDLLNVQLASIFGKPQLANGALFYNNHSYMPGDIVSNGSTLGKVAVDGTIVPQ